MLGGLHAPPSSQNHTFASLIDTSEMEEVTKAVPGMQEQEDEDLCEGHADPQLVEN